MELKELTLNDEQAFLEMVHASQALHHPWVKAPESHEAFIAHYRRAQLPQHQSYLVWDQNALIGVYNLNEIVRGCFQSAYLGFYVNAAFAGQGLMSQSLQVLLKTVFVELGLHRLEANIQPENHQSIYLVQKNAFQKEGFSPKYLFIDNAWRDHERWAITKETWIANAD